jgi:deazaflavin-dependent oxidoreductase (nitroreductase family)
MAIGTLARSLDLVNGADTIGEELAQWGKVALLETRGRVSGHAVRAAIGFVEDPNGSLLVAAGTEEADWALNLRASGQATVKIGDQVADYDAVELVDADRNAAITALILKYGTPAERLGRGPAFRLTRVQSP